MVQLQSYPLSSEACADSSDNDELNGTDSVVLSQGNKDRNRAKLNQHEQHHVGNKPLSREASYSSLASETSSDYAFPPEDVASVKTDDSDIDRPLSERHKSLISETTTRKVCLILQ